MMIVAGSIVCMFTLHHELLLYGEVDQKLSHHVCPANGTATAHLIKAKSYPHVQNYIFYNYTELHHSMASVKNHINNNSTLMATASVAPCRFDPRVTSLLSHFPHVMEHLYACFDYWWDAKQRNPSIKPLLLYDQHQAASLFLKFNTTPFLIGMLDALKSQMGLEMIPLDNYTATSSEMSGVKPQSYHNDFKPIGRIYLLQHVHELIDMVHRHLKNLREKTLQNDPSSLMLIKQRIAERLAKYEKGYPQLSAASQEKLKHLLESKSKTQNIQNLASNSNSTIRNKGTSPQNLSSIRNSHCHDFPPNIGILSRKKTRTIQNIQYLSDRLALAMAAVYQDHQDNRDNLSTIDSDANHPYQADTVEITTNETTSNFTAFTNRRFPISVTYFEKTTFAEQVEFFSTTDILISVHGAQLTGLVFMGNKPCGQLLELYPHNYALPFYFGSLAVQAGVEHSYMYFGEKEMITSSDPTTQIIAPVPGGKVAPQHVLPWEVRLGQTHKERWWARQAHLCPSVDVTVEAIIQLVEDWTTCCREMQQTE
jgi:hypothetical protein